MYKYNLRHFLASSAELDFYNLHLGSLYSCHICASSSAIPYIVIDFSNTSTTPNLMSFFANLFFTTNSSTQYNTGTYTYSANALQKNWLTNSSTNFGINDVNYVGIIFNCALGTWNFNSIPKNFGIVTTTPNSANSFVFCYACSPGFKQTKIDSITYPATNRVALLMVTSCTAIPNCQTGSTWMNACSACSINSCYEYNLSNSAVLYDKRTIYPDNNCFSVNVNGVVPSCQICKPSYILNSDKICEMFTKTDCNDNRFIFNTNFTISATFRFYSTGLYFLSKGTSCKTCSANFIPILQTKPNSIFCSVFNYVTMNSYLTVTHTNFDFNCQNYRWDSVNNIPTCVVCLFPYIQNLEGGCIRMLSNCNIALNKINFFRCETSYTNVGGTCQLKAIDNCQVYTDTISNSCQIWESCNDGYFPQGSKYILGNIPKCLVYQSQLKCSQCINSYVSILLQSSSSFCYPIPINQNCSVADSSFVNGVYSCQKCAPNNAV